MKEDSVINCGKENVKNLLCGN